MEASPGPSYIGGKKKKKENLLGKENGSIQARQISHFRRAYRTEKEKNSRIS